MKDWRAHAAIALALVAAVVAVYLPVRHHAFVDPDDFAGILWNSDLEVGSLLEALRVAFTHQVIAMWAPATMLSLQLDRALYGQEPAGYLLTNVALHAATSLLLFHALWRSSGARWASAFVAAVFALHPLHVESVAWASERKDTLSGFFFALTWLAYLRHAEWPDSRAREALLIAVFAIGLLAKPMLVTLPGVLLLLDYWPLRRLDLRAVRDKLPLFALALTDAYVTWSVQASTGSMSFGASIPLRYRVANAVDSTCLYLWKTLWPTDLAAFYPHPGGSLGHLRPALELGLLLALTAAAFAVRRTQPWWLVGWLWYLVTLLPVIGLVQVGMQGHADRYTYLPMIGPTIALAFAVRHVARTPALRAAAAAAGSASLAALAVGAAAQVHTWRDSYTLYQRVMEVSPQSSYPHLRVGMLHAIDGEFYAAEDSFQRAVALEPADAREIVRLLDALAQGHAHMGRGQQAADVADYAIRFAEQTGQSAAASELRARRPELLRSGAALRAPTPLD